jgi:predicted membrane-bound mannosyltransferase
MGFRHAVRLFLLNAVLYGSCAAFAGLIVGDYLPVEQQGRVIVAFGVVPLVVALVSTVAHMRAHRWTSVDDMAERFTHPHQQRMRGDA